MKRAMPKRPTAPATPPVSAPHVAVIGAGIAGLACARTLLQGGLRVTLFERGTEVGGRTSSLDSPFGSFDSGAQYFTVRDKRFEQALATAPGAVRRWSANAVRVLDPHGRVVEAALPARESHWVGTPRMDELARQWARPFRDAGLLELETRVTRIERDTLAPSRWQLQTAGANDAVHVYSGFDAVLLAIPSAQAAGLLSASQVDKALAAPLEKVDVAPCWTLMLAYPQAVQPTLPHLGPQWNAALSTHHRVAWLARESSKPGRSPVERWTVQASADWSREHLMDDGHRVRAKLLKAFGEVTGILADPAHAEVMRWRWAKTVTPLGQSHLWHARQRIGLCGDWCTGHRVEEAFLSGLALALDVLAA